MIFLLILVYLAIGFTTFAENLPTQLHLGGEGALRPLLNTPFEYPPSLLSPADRKRRATNRFSVPLQHVSFHQNQLLHFHR